MTSIENGEGSVTEFHYDRDGNLVMHRNAEGETTIFNYTSTGQLLEVDPIV